MRLRISARKSDLARLQAYRVADAVKNVLSTINIEFNFRESLGDKNLTDPLWKLPEKGVFTEDFYKDLTEGKTDIVVHSWKDLPVEGKPDTEIVATLPRADSRDLFLFKKSRFGAMSGRNENTLRIYSSSPRRAYNLSPFFQEYLPFQGVKPEFISVRGNIQTRIKKLFESEDVDGLIVAKAAIDRLLESSEADLKETKDLVRTFLDQCLWMVLPLSINPCAAAQGAIAIEVLSSNANIKNLISKINHQETFEAVQKERKILASYGGGCHQKIGAAVVNKKYGQAVFLKGETESGIILNQIEIEAHKEFCDIPNGFKNTDLLVSSDLSAYFQSESIINEVSLKRINEAKGLIVSKDQAWPDRLQWNRNKPLVWSAGLKTWKALAQKQIWVSGTFDGLGETEAPEVQSLIGGDFEWIKLTHADSKSQDRFKTVLTYKLTQVRPLPDLSKVKCFYWTSPFFFQKAVESNSAVLEAWHSCGPGNSYDIIAKSLKQAYMKKPLSLFIDSKSWRDHVLR